LRGSLAVGVDLHDVVVPGPLGVQERGAHRAADPHGEGQAQHEHAAVAGDGGGGAGAAVVDDHDVVRPGCARRR
jgi:hypothetical protein